MICWSTEGRWIQIKCQDWYRGLYKGVLKEQEDAVRMYGKNAKRCCKDVERGTEWISARCCNSTEGTRPKASRSNMFLVSVSGNICVERTNRLDFRSSGRELRRRLSSTVAVSGCARFNLTKFNLSLNPSVYCKNQQQL